MSKVKFKVGKKTLKVNDAPVGLLLLDDGYIICKSEYKERGEAICTILSSGENYCGGNKDCKSLNFIPTKEFENKFKLSVQLNVAEKKLKTKPKKQVVSTKETPPTKKVKKLIPIDVITDSVKETLNSEKNKK